MKKQMTIGKKITLGFMALLSLTIIMGVMCFVGISKLSDARNVLSDRVAGATIADQVPFWSIKQYQNQADFIINRDLSVVDDFNESAAQMDIYRDQLEKIVDTQEEREWFSKLKKSDEAFDNVFRTKILPEMKHRLNDFTTKYDSEADEYIENLLTASRKIEASVKDEVMAKISDNELKGNIEALLATKDMSFWILKQYQNQADLTINQNLKSVDDFKNSVAQIDLNKAILERLLDTPERKQAIATINEYDKKYDALFFGKVVPEVKRILENRIGQYDGESDSYMSVVEDMSKKISASLRAEADEASVTFNKVYKLVNTLVIVFSISCVILGSCVAFVIIRSLTRTLKRIINSLQESSEQVSEASGQVLSASQLLAQGATEQAAGLEETSSSLEEMASMTKQNADNAQQANTLAAEARKAADNGTQSMGKMNAAIQEIQKSSDETAKIIKVIDEIAFQTNLLALNAAVEAARAGEAGKGFAVVAEEVRNLAMRSAEAAKNTASMIEEAVKNSKNGVDIAAEVDKVLDEIVQGVGKTTALVSEIAAASQEQAMGIDQINIAVAQIDKVTQQNAGNAEESASASEELSAQAESMKQVVNDLITLVGGSSLATGRMETLHKHTISDHDGILHQIAEGTSKNVKRVTGRGSNVSKEN